MKNSILVFSGLVILGICMIISSIIFSNNLATNRHIVEGTLGMSQPNKNSFSEDNKEYMAIGDISRLLGYDDIDKFTQDVLDGELYDLPYVNLKGKLIFSRTAFQAWLVESATFNKEY